VRAPRDDDPPINACGLNYREPSANAAHTLAPVQDRANGNFFAQGQQQFSRDFAAASAQPQVAVAVFDENDPNAANVGPSVPEQLESNDEESVETHAGAWARFGRLQQNRKENKQETMTFDNAKPLPLGKRAEAMIEAGIDIYADSAEGSAGFTVFAENPELPEHLVARMENNLRLHQEPASVGGQNAEPLAVFQAVADSPVAQAKDQAAPVVSSSDFFANIFQDNSATAKPKKAKSLASAPSAKYALRKVRTPPASVAQSR